VGTGAATGIDMPTGAAGVLTPVPTVAPAGVVGAPPATQQP
jgi:hypothetical protein